MDPPLPLTTVKCEPRSWPAFQNLIEYWADDAATRVILMYIENFGNPRKFTRIARNVTRVKPIIAVKAGRTAARARAASSHTGALAGVDRATDALLTQCGVIRVDSVEELFDLAMAFGLLMEGVFRCRPPKRHVNEQRRLERTSSTCCQ
ncbi:MAG TPA: hypothetical protein VMN60_11305 [Longimicrobiales bacterium]|nr:hypothetical protein [Longimicrobiales bacterium]